MAAKLLKPDTVLKRRFAARKQFHDAIDELETKIGIIQRDYWAFLEKLTARCPHERVYIESGQYEKARRICDDCGAEIE